MKYRLPSRVDPSKPSGRVAAKEIDLVATLPRNDNKAIPMMTSVSL
jgi:hypothetical protein